MTRNALGQHRSRPTRAAAVAVLPGDTHPVHNRRPSRTRIWLFGAHAALVLGLLVLFVLIAELANPTDGANIGAGILLLPLLPLGLPWSLPVIVDPYRFDPAAEALVYTLYLGPALLNVALHGLLLLSCSVLRAQHSVFRAQQRPPRRAPWRR
ncbi:hypothetical protein QM806_28085 [Rhodococcus sp. IEGM 1351]|uniref:hypothetical protein n=1 Tax=Rhodococcus sp. IEGM 1351 TaxID=3047089 RepID=UPI0024B852E1|nr:hypothetical protein [Rhodococcus sp. IEGM 1351]MDI9939242.1 hypothetical protein [Rhodococcus sp. IEGM 1351]